jgi:pyrimidine deaminase RibD-like protein
MSASEHERSMRHALAVARSVWGQTQPNPMVGAVIVEEGRVVAEGATAPDGGPHAERAALRVHALQRRERHVHVEARVARVVGQRGHVRRELARDDAAVHELRRRQEARDAIVEGDEQAALAEARDETVRVQRPGAGAARLRLGRAQQPVRLLVPRDGGQRRPPAHRTPRS